MKIWWAWITASITTIGLLRGYNKLTATKLFERLVPDGLFWLVIAVLVLL